MLTKLIWNPESTPTELRPMLESIAEEYPVSPHGRGLKVTFEKIKSTGVALEVVRSKGEVKIRYSSVSAAARGVGAAMSKIDGKESTPLQTLGIMLDVSRNMVMKVEHVKFYLRKMALAGYNLLMLYTEDTYELDDEPFFGYMRGAYTIDEIKEIDSYAASLGIEVVGCIQTLGHMRQFLKWTANSEYRDTGSVMLTDSDKTYALIDKMLSFWSEALSSRRIHIGMDETHDLGLGRHLDIHGFENQAQIFNRHLAKVNDMCRRHGLAPMIWSDMFFRLANKTHNYYDFDCVVPKKVKDTIPKNVQLVYWDYYHRDKKDYATMIRRHRNLGFEPVVAGCIMTWGNLWYKHDNATLSMLPCIAACREEKIKELIFTMWGDDGAYCDFDSALAGVFFLADQVFGNKDQAITGQRFDELCFSSYEAHVAAGYMSPCFEYKDQEYWCHAPQLLWDDPLFGIAFDSHKRHDPEFDLKLLDYYDELLCRLLPHIDEYGAGDIEHAINIINLIMRKVELRGALEAAYDTGDRLALRDIAVTMIPTTIAAVNEFDSTFRRQWLEKAKPFGLEHIQSRNATLVARLEETELRIREYLNGEVEAIDELDARIPHSAEANCYSGWYEFYRSGSLTSVN